jgi:hypothetical protein
VREFNAREAAGIALMLKMAPPGWGQPPSGNNVAANATANPPGMLAACGRCGQTNPLEAHFCSGCGAAL